MKKSFTFRAIALMVVACMTLTFILAGALPEDNLEPYGEIVDCGEGGSTETGKSDDADDTDKPDDEDDSDEPNDDENNEPGGEYESGEPGDENPDDIDDEPCTTDDTPSDTEDKGEEDDTDGSSIGLYGQPGDSCEYTQALDLLGAEILSTPAAVWVGGAGVNVSESSVYIDVSSNTTGTLTIIDDDTGEEVRLIFSGNGYFNGNIVIGDGARVIFNTAGFRVTATGNISNESGALSNGLVISGGGTLILAGTVNIALDINTLYGISVSDGNLEITGNTTIVCTDDGPFGLYTYSGDVTINSSGKVEIGKISINVDGSFEIKSGTVIVEGKIELTGDCVITISGGVSTIGGIVSERKITISSGVTTINGSLLSNGADITISGGATTITGSIGSYYSGVGDVVISGGSVSVSDAIYSKGDVDISSGTVEVSYGIFSDGDVSISGGTVEVDGIVESFGGDVNITGGTVKIDGSIFAYGDVNIENSTVTISTDDANRAAIEAQSIYIKNSFGSLSSESDYAVVTSSDTTLHIDPALTVWKSGDTTTLAARSEDNTHFVAAGTDTPLGAVEFAAFTVTVVNGTLEGGGTTGGFKANSTVHITANTPPAGQKFSGWTITPARTPTVGTLSTPDIEFTMPFANVTATANYEPLPPNEHTITVTHTGKGVANPSVNAAVQGTVITLTATPDSGNRFVRWDVVSGTITLSSTTTATATFVMPNTAVTVNAVFEPIPGTTTPTSPKMGDAGPGALLALLAMSTGGATFAGIKAVSLKRNK